MRKEQERDDPGDYSSLENLKLPEVLKSYRPEGFPFLLKDSFPYPPRKKNKRILIFGLDRSVRLLEKATQLLGDGTFKVAPALWAQLYTIHGTFNGWTFPLFYCLLPDKTRESYQFMWEHLSDALSQKGVRLPQVPFLQDFEFAAWGAAQVVFGRDAPKGCWFHLCHSIHQKMVDLGLKMKYAADQGFRARVLNISSLAYCAPRDIGPTWTELSKEFQPDEHELRDYFEQSYVGKWGTRSRSRVRERPLFDHEFWSLYGRREHGLSTTTNACERYHKRVNGRANRQVTTLPELADNLKEEEDRSTERLVEYMKGKAHEPRHPFHQWPSKRDEILKHIQKYEESRQPNGLRDEVTLVRGITAVRMQVKWL